MEVFLRGVESRLPALADATAQAKPGLGCSFALHHSSWQGRVLNPLNEARDQTCVLMDALRFVVAEP